MMNAGNGYSTFWAPVVNLAREPRWGRNIEVPGEDPYLSSEYAINYVKGMEQAPEDPYHVQASACCKHFVANEMEHSTVDGVTWTRHNFDEKISMQDLVDSYMLPFQACVEKGHVTGLMCSYNAVNGVPSCANDWLLNKVAREAWQFDGYITSDCDADDDVFSQHHFTATPEETVRDVLRAGTDVDCTRFVCNHAQSALDKGLITEADIDERLKMLFKVRMRLSHFDPVGPLQRIPESTICSDYAKQLSFDGTAQSANLIKNDNKMLPLSKTTAGKVSVIGPNSNLSKSDSSYYGPGNPCGGKFWTLVDAIEQYTTVETTLGVPNVLSEDTTGIPAAVAMAKEADTVVLAVGTDLTWAREEQDATSIEFTAAQKELISKVAEAAKKPVLVVVMTATPLDLTEVLANPKVGSVMHLGQPSVSVFGAGDVIFGKKSPAGRAIQTVYPRSYADEVSIFDFNMRPGPSEFPRPDCGKPAAGCPNGTNPGRTYRFYTGEPVVPFGFGLSYTTFKYTPLAGNDVISLSKMDSLLETERHGFVTLAAVEQAGAAAQFFVNVTNTGDVDADDVVLGFITPPGAGKDGVPLKSLFGFERVHVRAKETVTVNLYPDYLDFTLVTTEGKHVPHDGQYRIEFGVRETAIHGMGFAEKFVTAEYMDKAQYV
jgi:beta-glucosidase-like glycosyl hydrolase